MFPLLKWLAAFLMIRTHAFAVAVFVCQELARWVAQTFVLAICLRKAFAQDSPFSWTFCADLCESFRRWLWVYKTFVVFMLVLVTYMAICTFFTVFSGVTKAMMGEDVAWWLTVGPMTAVDPSGVTKDGSTAIASITTTTASPAITNAALAVATKLQHHFGH